MKGPTPFDPAVAGRYDERNLAQRDAGERLLALLALRGDEDLLDVGCGTGLLAALAAGRTRGRVLGIDPSPGMIAVARGRAGPRLAFEVLPAEELSAEAAFDAALSNSAFHWFHDQPRALANLARALRPGARLALQAPATSRYCPAFVEAVAQVARHPDTAATFAGWRSPWTFAERAEEAAALAEAAGLRVLDARLEPQVLRVDAEGAMRVFESAAAAGYLADGRYPAPPGEPFRARALGLVRAHFERLAAGGPFDLVIQRLWLLAAAR